MTMFNAIHAPVGVSSGCTRTHKALALVATNAGNSKAIRETMGANLLTTLWASFMTWQQVAVIAILIVGGCFLAFLGKETLAGTILGAAAGFISQPFFKRKEHHPRDGDG